MSQAVGFCSRCGHAVTVMHTRPECDAYYDRAYQAALDRAVPPPPERPSTPLPDPVIPDDSMTPLGYCAMLGAVVVLIVVVGLAIEAVTGW